LSSQPQRFEYWQQYANCWVVQLGTRVPPEGTVALGLQSHRSALSQQTKGAPEVPDVPLQLA
jgi:hypothetical protein